VDANVVELRKRLSRIIFRIHIKEGSRHYYGTGFFISESGLALTAFHNLPKRMGPRARIHAEFRGQPIQFSLKFSTRPDKKWQKKVDVAVLQGPAGLVSSKDVIPIAYLDPAVERPGRASFWLGKQVALMGFPLRTNFGPKRVLGSIHADEPIQNPPIVDAKGNPVGYAFDALAFGDDFQKNCEDIQGVSGGPIYDFKSERIIGVQFSAWPDRQRCFATELCHVKQLLDKAGASAGMLHLPTFSKERASAGAAEPDILKDLSDQLKAWFSTLGYRKEGSDVLGPGQLDWVINVPTEDSYERVLVRAVEGEAYSRHAEDLYRCVQYQKLDKGWLVAYYRVSSKARTFAQSQGGGRKLFCYTFDELIDKKADFRTYMNWLDNAVNENQIAERYVRLACRKEEHGSDMEKTPAEARYDDIDKYVDQWLMDPNKGHVSVLGEFGTGKTWFTLHYAWHRLRLYREAVESGVKRPRLPLLIPLQDYVHAGTVEGLLSEFFFRKHSTRLPAYSAFEQLNRMGKLLLIFDGFDEMAARVDRQRMENNFRELARVVVPGAKAILTCRTEYFPKWTLQRDLFLKGHFEILKLEKFNDEQIRKVLSIRAPENTVNRIMSREALLNLVRRPVMTGLILDALPKIEAGGAIDISRVYLYAVQSKLIREVTEKHAIISLAQALCFLCELSWEMLSTNKMSLNYREFPERVRRLFGEKVQKEKDLDHWQAAVASQTLLIPTEDGDYFFAHRSLVEFFIAYKFVAELGVLDEDFVQLARNSSASGPDAALPRQDYRWSEYFQGSRENQNRMAPLGSFRTEDFNNPEINFAARKKLTRNTLPFAALMVSREPESLQRLCAMALEQSGVQNAHSLSLLPFMKDHPSVDKLARMMVEKKPRKASCRRYLDPW